MKTFIYRFLEALSFILFVIVMTGCESDENNSFQLSVLFRKDTVTYYEDDMTIKNYPVLSGSQIPYIKTLAMEDNTIETRFKNPSSDSVYLGWLMYDPKEDDWESEFTLVGQDDDFYVESSFTNVKVRFFTVAGIGDSCSDTVQVIINSDDSLSIIPSEIQVTPLAQWFDLTALSVPTTTNLYFSVNNFSDQWIAVIYEVRANLYGMHFIKPSAAGASYFSGPLNQVVKLGFFGLKI